MNQKETGELRKRFNPEKSAVERICGCYVNSQKEVVSYLDESLGRMPREEAEKYLSLMKKVLSGTQGKNLIDIFFSNQQVMDSDEHRMFMALRDRGSTDRELREEFYQKVIDSLDMGEDNYLILLANDAYDVPRKGKDGNALDSENVFRYVVCCICPVKDGKLELGYFPGENEFHNTMAGQIVGAPELGFLFPAFDNRCANIYNALLYARKPEELHQEFIDGIFHTEPPMSSGEQKEAFRAALTEALEEECTVDVVQTLHERLGERIAEHKESRDPEPLNVTPKELAGMLTDSGVSEERAQRFVEACGEQFGSAAVLSPENLIDSHKYEIKTEDATVQITPERSYLVETRVINGRKYLLIPVEDAAEINGLSVRIPGLDPVLREKLTQEVPTSDGESDAAAQADEAPRPEDAPEPADIAALDETGTQEPETPGGNEEND